MSGSAQKIHSVEPIRLGDYAAAQPLSGTRVVTKMQVKGFSGAVFIRDEEQKKAG